MTDGCNNMTVFTNFNDIVSSGKKYDIIYADPPWSYWTRCKKNASRHYDVMDLEDIKQLPVEKIVNDNSVLCMWITFPLLDKIKEMCEIWGFTYATVLFVWIKKNKNDNTNFWGMGNYTRTNAEIVILAKRGKGLSVHDRAIHQIVTTPISDHSKKPNIIRQKICKLFEVDPTKEKLNKIELFARGNIHGWDVFGNDAKLKLKSLDMFNSITEYNE